MSKKINIIFIIPSLRAGGAERVMSFISMNLNKKLFLPHLLVIGSRENQSYDIKGIPVTFLEKKRVRDGLWPIAKFLNTQNVDIVVSSMSHVNTLMAFLSFFFPKKKFIGRETIVKSGKSSYQEKEKNLSLLYKLQSKSLDFIICQSNDMKMDLINNYSYPKDKLIVINNPITSNFQLKKNSTSKLKRLITVGRLTKQKGYIRIINALAKLSIPFHYIIIGNGSEKEAILRCIKNNNLEDKISHIPFTKEVDAYLSKSDLYLQGSFVEGFPNALLESCAVGTPVLAFNALGGINEIIQEGVNGYIANDDEDFRNKLIQALNREWNPEKIRKTVTSRYSEEIVLKNYEDFFENIIK